MYGNIIDFCVCLVSCDFAQLMYWFKEVFLCVFLGIFYIIMSSANGDDFTVPFAVRMPFIPSSVLTMVVRTSSTAQDNGGGSRHPCLTLTHKAK